MPIAPWAWLARQATRFSPMNLLEKWENRRFDARHGTETLADVRLQGLAIDSPNRQLGNRYHPTPPRALRSVLARLAIDPADYSFVDIGSGKGRVLLVASAFPFKRIVGVEFAEELHRVAQSNIAAFLGRERGPVRHGPIESVLADATQYALPAGNLVLYFFQPFHGGVLREVLRNVRRAIDAAGARVWIVFFYLDNQRAVFDEVGGFEHRFAWRMFDVFESRPG